MSFQILLSYQTDLIAIHSFSRSVSQSVGLVCGCVTLGWARGGLRRERSCVCVGRSCGVRAACLSPRGRAPFHRATCPCDGDNSYSFIYKHLMHLTACRPGRRCRSRCQASDTKNQPTTRQTLPTQHDNLNDGDRRHEPEHHSRSRSGLLRRARCIRRRRAPTPPSWCKADDLREINPIKCVLTLHSHILHLRFAGTMPMPDWRRIPRHKTPTAHPHSCSCLLLV